MFAENNFVFGLIAIILISHTFAIFNIYKRLKTTDFNKKEKIRRKTKYFTKIGWSYYLHIAMTKDKENIVEVDFDELMSFFPKDEGYYSSESDGQLVFSRGNAIRYGLIEFDRTFYLIKTEFDYLKFVNYIEEYVERERRYYFGCDPDSDISFF